MKGAVVKMLLLPNTDIDILIYNMNFHCFLNISVKRLSKITEWKQHNFLTPTNCGLDGRSRLPS